MGIERSQAPSVQKTAEPQPNKARNTSDAPEQAGGFAAVMQAQEPPEAPPAPEAKGAEKPAAKTSEAKAQDDEAKAPDADDAHKTSTEAQGAAQDAAAALALVAAYLLGTPAAPQPVATAKAQPTADGKLVGVADADVPGTDGSKRPAAVVVGAAATAATAAGRVDARAPASTLANYASVLEQLQSRLAKGELPADEGGVSTTTLDTGATPGKPAAGLLQQNARMDRLMAALQGGTATTGEVSKLASLASDASGALRSTDRLRAEPARPASGNGAEGAFGQHGFTPTVQFDGSAVPAAVASQATGDAVADQVSYFVSQGIQNAELTLDGLNSERVEVKISMSGKEAHVEFRSDQLATREMLAGTTAHLKDLLSSQGVVLTGVTVSHAGAEFSGGQEPQGRSREGQAQGRATAGESRTVAAVATAAARAPAGALDLFV